MASFREINHKVRRNKNNNNNKLNLPIRLCIFIVISYAHNTLAWLPYQISNLFAWKNPQQQQKIIKKIFVCLKFRKPTDKKNEVVIEYTHVLGNVNLTSEFLRFISCNKNMCMCFFASCSASKSVLLLLSRIYICYSKLNEKIDVCFHFG